jgi:hypothetical protein
MSGRNAHSIRHPPCLLTGELPFLPPHAHNPFRNPQGLPTCTCTSCLRRTARCTASVCTLKLRLVCAGKRGGRGQGRKACKHVKGSQPNHMLRAAAFGKEVEWLVNCVVCAPSLFRRISRMRLRGYWQGWLLGGEKRSVNHGKFMELALCRPAACVVHI